MSKDYDVTSTEARREMTAKLVSAMGNKKFCPYCRKDKPLETGTKLKYSWLCKDCGSKRKANESARVRK